MRITLLSANHRIILETADSTRVLDPPNRISVDAPAPMTGRRSL